MLRDVWAEIDLNRIRGNLRAIRRTLPESVKLMAVVKANAYGHGDVEVASAAAQAGADALAVAFLEEAIRLRTNGVALPILILAPIRPELVPLALDFDLTLTVANAEWFAEARAYKPVTSPGKLRVHVKADTGLGRIGIREKAEWDGLLPWLEAPDVDVEGFYTHFATSGQADTGYVEEQATRFAAMKEWVRESGLNVRCFHCAGSAAALRFPELAMDMVRIGAAMYGFYPEKLVRRVKLEPALNLHAKLIHVKMVAEGEFIGYDNAYRADEDEWIGTVPIGYADGWSQRMRDTDVLVGGRRATIVGKIGMDQLTIKLPGPCAVGDVVTLVGVQGDERVTIPKLAEPLGCAPQELSSMLTSRVERTYSEQEEAKRKWDNHAWKNDRKRAANG